jgi:hypothetical protein
MKQVEIPRKLIEDARHYLKVAQVPCSTDAILIPFFDTCEMNDTVSALQSAPKRNAGDSTWGLKKAVNAGSLALAGKLLAFGAKLDSFPV